MRHRRKMFGHTNPNFQRLIDKMSRTTKATDSKEKSPPFKQDSEEFRSLVLMFKKGQIKVDEKPGNVRSKFLSTFGKFTPAQFRSQHSKARALSGVTGKHDRTRWLHVICVSLFLFGSDNATRSRRRRRSRPNCDRRWCRGCGFSCF